MFTHVMFKLSSNTISKAGFFFYKVTTLVYSLYAALWLYFDSDSLPLQKPWTFHCFIVIKCWFQDIVGCLQNLISPVEYIGIGIFFIHCILSGCKLCALQALKTHWNHPVAFFSFAAKPLIRIRIRIRNTKGVFFLLHHLLDFSNTTPACSTTNKTSVKHFVTFF